MLNMCWRGSQVIKMIHVIVCCTEREAENLGVFMLELLIAIEAWRVHARSSPGPSRG